MTVLEEKELWQKVVEGTRSALDCGALQPIPTRLHVVEEANIAFVVRLAVQMPTRLRKSDSVVSENRAGPQAPAANPFLPYEDELFIADVTPTHLCLLNKFNVLDHHLLIVTRQFEEQESPLNLDDFEAMWTCLNAIPPGGLAFYNAGTAAGASQRHKHLQLVPLPLGPGPESFPLAPVLAAHNTMDSEPLVRVPELPFVHVLASMEEIAFRPPAVAARRTLDLYQRMLDRVERRAVDPYNLLVTRRWMLLVPRRRQRCRGVEVNAMGFAGALLARNAEQLDTVEKLGPLNVLRHVAVPSP